MKIAIFWFKFHLFRSQGSNLQLVIIDSDDDLALYRHQAIIWSIYDGLTHWGIYASFNLDLLT